MRFSDYHFLKLNPSFLRLNILFFDSHSHNVNYIGYGPFPLACHINKWKNEFSEKVSYVQFVINIDKIKSFK